MIKIEKEEKIQLLQKFMKSVDDNKELRKKAMLQSLNNKKATKCK